MASLVVGEHGDDGRPMELCRKGETKGGSPGLSGEPVFARNCYTRFFRTSIENPKSARRMTREELERL